MTGNRICNNHTQTLLGSLMLMGLLGFGGVGNMPPPTPYSPYFGPHQGGEFFIGDFRDVSEIENLP
ncbi:MAG: hypothetical protein FWB76_06530 [Oscillospiraceae bacterium]|nr:hypothetical protein [Oscillospiraceae bacterium]